MDERAIVRDRDLRPLVAVAALVSALGASGVIPLWPGSVHQVALPPLDLFADVRVLLAESPSYPAFVVQLVVVFAARTAVLATMVGALDRGGLARAACFYGAALPVAVVAGGLAYSGVNAVYSPFLWGGVALAVATLVAMGGRPWRHGTGRHRTLRVVVYLAALLVVSLLSAVGGSGARLALVWVSAALTAVTIRWLDRDRPTRTRNRAPLPVVLVPAVLPALLALPVSSPVSSPVSPPLASRPEGTLFVVPGIDGSSGDSTMFRLDPAALGYDCDSTVYFSYAGTGPGAPQRGSRCPIRTGAPYGPDDTLRPLEELVDTFRAQYAQLEPPVLVIAHSQGGWIATAALGTGSTVPAPTALVLLGAFPGHRSAYQLDGHGEGVVGTGLLEALTALLRGLHVTAFDPRAPLPRELLATPGAIERHTQGALAAGVRVITVTSALDLPVMAGDGELPGAEQSCPVYVHHGHLPESARALAEVRQALGSPDGRRCAWWRRWPAQAFSSFAVPTG